MTQNLKKRKASLMNVIQALDEADAVFSEDIELDSLDEQLPEELDSEELAPLAEDAEIPEDLEETEGDFEVAEDEVDEDVLELPEDQDDEAILSDEEEDDLAFLDEFEEEETTTASEVTPGIEDEIGDEANGGDPSVSEIAEGGEGVEVSTDAEVFPTESEYVAKITARLDRVANYLEKHGQKKMAYRIDLLSDRLEASIRK
jgi:hypothetical protein